MSVFLLAACANIQAPPGGPPDTTPPALASVYPDSLAVLPGFKGNVEFRFNEVISEGTTPNTGRGTGDLEKLVILSPTTKFPDVSWHRRRITVRPAEGWQPNRVYRVELLPGIADVRQNRSKAEAVVTFTTGAEVPRDTLRGVVFDWRQGSPAPQALVEALLEPDSLPYRAVTDSSGEFAFGPLPHGEYLIYGVLDQNRNLRLDRREAFDTIRMQPESIKTAKAELYAFLHDTLPPRIQQITPIDSLSASIMFTQSLDPYQKLKPSAATVRKLPDSTIVPVVALLLHDTTLGAGLEPGLMRRRDTTAVPRPRDLLPRPRRADSLGLSPTDTAAERLTGLGAQSRPRMNRPPLSDHITIKVGTPWHQGDQFFISLTGIRTVSGRAGDVRAPFLYPKPRTPVGGGLVPSDTAAFDSLKARRDSLMRKQPDD